MSTMVMVPLAKVKVGDRLNQDVYSVLGGLILYKDRIISSQDLEVLEAFLIKQIEVYSNYNKETVIADCISRLVA